VVLADGLTSANHLGECVKAESRAKAPPPPRLLRFLADYGLTVIEVDRPDRAARHRSGKSDPLDAESAAGAVQSGRAGGTPKSRDAQVEMIRVLRVARRGAMKARIQAGAQIDAIIVSAPEQVRAPLAQAQPAPAHTCLRRPAPRTCPRPRSGRSSDDCFPADAPVLQAGCLARLLQGFQPVSRFDSPAPRA
jgi:hypothetical protein